MRRPLRMNLTGKTAPEPRSMAKFAVFYRPLAPLTGNLLLTNVNVRMAIYKEQEQASQPVCSSIFVYTL